MHVVLQVLWNRGVTTEGYGFEITGDLALRFVAHGVGAVSSDAGVVKPLTWQQVAVTVQAAGDATVVSFSVEGKSVGGGSLAGRVNNTMSPTTIAAGASGANAFHVRAFTSLVCRVCVCACLCACVRVCVCACVRVFVRACVRACVPSCLCMF
jgi:hypothetical protein